MKRNTLTFPALVATLLFSGAVFAQDSPGSQGRGRADAGMMAQHQQMRMMSMPAGMKPGDAGAAQGGATGADHEQHHPGNKAR